MEKIGKNEEKVFEELKFGQTIVYKKVRTRVAFLPRILKNLRFYLQK